MIDFAAWDSAFKDLFAPPARVTSAARTMEKKFHLPRGAVRGCPRVALSARQRRIGLRAARMLPSSVEDLVYADNRMFALMDKPV